MDKRLIGELMGTLVLILLGNGVVANVSLRKSKAENAGWMVVTTGWALAVMCGVFTAIACGSSDAHLNPAVTLGFAVSSGDFSKVAPYAVAQLLGAILGQSLVWLHFLPHWKATPEADRKLGCFSTSPAIHNPAANLLTEAIGTFVLVLVAGAIFSKTALASGPAPGLGPYLVGSLVWGIGLSLGGTTGHARPRERHQLSVCRLVQYLGRFRIRHCRRLGRRRRVSADRRHRFAADRRHLDANIPQSIPPATIQD